MKKIRDILTEIDEDIEKQHLARNTGRILAKQSRITDKK